MENGYANLNGGRHYFEIVGSGHPLVLVNGFTLDTRMWDPQIEAFSSKYRVIRYDLRAAGKSDPPNGPFSYCDDLAALLDYLGVPSAHVLGLSRGGSIAVDLALAHPDKVRSLIPVDTSVLGGFPWHPKLKVWFDAILEAAKKGDIDAAKERWMEAGWFTHARKQPAVEDHLRRIIADYSGWHFLNQIELLELDPPAGERLSEIDVPTLVVVGELDLPFYNHPISDLLANGIKGSRKVVIADAGHFPNMEAPKVFNDTVLAFLAQVDAATR